MAAVDTGENGAAASNSSLVPSTLVTCTFATVFETKATRYFAVAPVYYFTNFLSEAMYNDIAAMMQSQGGNDACCSLLASPVAPTATSSPPAPTKASPAATPSSNEPVPCICMQNLTLVALDKRFNSNPTLLGITFQVDLAIGFVPTLATAPADAATPPNPHALASLKGASTVAHHASRDAGAGAAPLSTARRAVGSAAAPTGNDDAGTAVVADKTATGTAAVPYVWTLSQDDAFPHVRGDLFMVLTRRYYLSNMRSAVHVFGHVTLRDLRTMLTLDSDGLPHTTPALAHLGDPVDYCRILNTPAASLRPSLTVTGGVKPVWVPGTNISYPSNVVATARSSYASTIVAQCDGATCGVGILCASVMVILIVGAAVAYAQQLYRRRRDEMEDERQLLKQQLR